MQSYAERRLQEDKAMRDLVQQVAEGHMNSKTVKEKLRKMKQNIGELCHPSCCLIYACTPWHWRHFHASHWAVREVSEQNRELLRAALEEAQAELAKKFQLIKEIRAVESLPHIRIRNFDDTEVG